FHLKKNTNFFIFFFLFTSHSKSPNYRRGKKDMQQMDGLTYDDIMVLRWQPYEKVLCRGLSSIYLIILFIINVMNFCQTLIDITIPAFNKHIEDPLVLHILAAVGILLARFSKTC
ncbi:hypothetical protein ACJX0J_023696, partial [Zea mays]